MSILTATNLSKSFGIQDVFWDIDVSIAHGEKIALVGANGAGKTTLLRILVGLEQPTTGVVSRMKNIRVGYLPQDAEHEGDETPWQLCCAAFANLQAMEAQLKELEASLGSPDDGTERMEKYGRLLSAFEHAGGYEFHVAIDTVLSGLGIDETHRHRPMSQLSGGQRTRVMLARLLLEKPNILVLDEPTNHLDIEAIEWLEKYLQEWPEAVLTVSHDRYFMDHVVQKIWELELGTLETYPGNYSKYVQLCQERMTRRATEWQEQQEYIAKEEAFIRRYMAGQRTREAQGRLKRLERLERLDRPRQSKTIHLRLDGSERSGELVLRTHNLVIGYNTPLVRLPDLELRRLTRAALLGPNGAGKTTLLKTILGQLPPFSGQVELGASLRIGYMSQIQEELDDRLTVIEQVTRAKDLLPGKMRDFLARFLFVDDDVFKRIGDLSGGERCRVVLAQLTLSEANLLVLDEPTNQLDIASQEILEAVLRDFVGTILMVSHDRYLIDALATQIWQIEQGSLRVYKSGYQDYVAQRQKEQTARREQNRQAEEPGRRRPPPTRPKTEPQPGRRLVEIEENIATLEQQIGQMEHALVEASQMQQLDRVHTLGVEYHQAREQLDKLIAEWEQLSEAMA